MGMYGGMVLGSLLAVVLLLGFAYIVWILAAKESGGIKLTGQIIAVIIAVLALIIFLYGGIYGGMMGRGWCGYGKGYRMMGPKMMHYMKGAPEEEMHEYMEKMMEDPRMRRWMEEYMEREEK